MENFVIFEVFEGLNDGKCLVVNGTRVSGPEPFGIPHLLDKWTVPYDCIVAALAAKERDQLKHDPPLIVMQPTTRPLPHMPPIWGL